MGELDEPISKAMLHMPMVHGIDVELPQDLRITVNRWSKHVDVIKARMELKVPDEDLLFPKPNPLAGDAEPKVRELSMCVPDVRAKAEAQCKESLGTHALGQVLEACVFDRCFGGEGFEA